MCVAGTAAGSCRPKRPGKFELKFPGSLNSDRPIVSFHPLHVSSAWRIQLVGQHTRLPEPIAFGPHMRANSSWEAGRWRSLEEANAGRCWQGRAAKYNVIANVSALILWDSLSGEMIGEAHSDHLRHYGTRRSKNPLPVLAEPFAVIASAISCILHPNGIPYSREFYFRACKRGKS